MKLPVDLRPEAADETDSVYEWYYKQRASLAEEFLAVLIRQLQNIQARPETWAKLYREIRACTLRRLPFVIYYQLSSDRVTIVAVQHGYRSPRAWRSRA